MKKIFRMALVFALAGATLMYTGCTKDYGEEIDRLDSKLSTVESSLSDKLTSLEGQLSTLKSTVSALESAYKAADDAIKGDVTKLQGRIAAVEDAIKDLDKLATKEELKEAKEALEAKIAADLESLKGEVLAKIDELQKQIDALNAALELKADADKVYTKVEVDELLAKYYTKDEIKEFLDKKADKDAVFTKDEIEAFLAEKADKAAVYTKEEVDELLSKYYTAEKIDEILKEYYTKEEIDAQFKNYFTKAEIEEMLEAYYTAEQIDEMLENYYTKEDIDKALEAFKEEIDGKLAEAQKKLDEAVELLSDELRSIVFLPDIYFAGVEATTYDFGSFLGFEIYKLGEDDTYNFDYGDPDGYTYATFPKGAKVEAGILYTHDAWGNPIYYKVDPETGDYVRDEDGNPVPAKNSDTNKDVYYPGNFVMGQIGKARYNLNPSSFAVADAEWSLLGRDVKYVVKSQESIWTPIFKGIEKGSDGVATVFYEIEHPEWLFSSVIGGVVEGVISWVNVISKIFFDDEQGQFPGFGGREGSEYNWYEYMQKWAAAWEYDFNNIPTMQLVGTLSDGRTINSDWHAISSFEEVVSHLAFRTDNPWLAYDDCGLSNADKDLFYSAYSVLDYDPSVQVKYNGGPVDLAKLISIHTFDFESDRPYGNYTLEEFNAKYPGFHYEFELVPYTLGNIMTGEEYYGKIEGTEFTPCRVRSVGGKPVSVVIPKDDESIEGISAVGRKPMVIATLVNDETGYVQTVGWFRILIVKDIKEPRFFELPELPKVPFICNEFDLATTWFDFSDFVLEALGMDYKLFTRTYTFEGVWGYFNEMKNGKLVKSFDKISVPYSSDETYGGLDFEDAVNGDEYWGEYYYHEDYNGSGINNAFEWYVDPQGLGEDSSRTIYWRFTNGEDVVYFKMTAEVAHRAKMDFVTNKINKEWFDDIDGEALNTVRLNVPVPTADKTDPVIGGNVLKFQRDINHWFVGYKPILALDEEASDPVYKNFFNAKNGTNPHNKGYKDPDADQGFDDPELFTHTNFFFDSKQPLIDGKYQLASNWWGTYTVTIEDADGNSQSVDVEQGKLLYVVDSKKSIPVAIDGDIDNMVMVPQPLDDNLVAWIMPRYIDEDNWDEGDVTTEDAFGGPRISDTLIYLHTVKAKELINLWSYKETDQAKMLYANIVAKNTYGWCEIDLPDGNFHVRFIRPLDVNFKNLDVAEESAVDGWNVLLAKFLSDITDWNNQEVIVRRPEYDANGKPKKDSKGNIIYTDYYMPNVIKTVDMFAYYGFTSLKIDLADAEINNWSTSDPAAWGKVSEKVPEARLAIGTVDEETGVFTPTTTTVYTLEFNGDLEGMDGYYLNYRNDEAYSDTFSLRIPVEIEYAWGTLKEKIQVNVKETSQTTPGN